MQAYPYEDSAFCPIMDDRSKFEASNCFNTDEVSEVLRQVVNETMRIGNVRKVSLIIKIEITHFSAKKNYH